MTRVGIGYDLHRLAEGRKLILGGIELAFHKGPVADVDNPPGRANCVSAAIGAPPPDSATS